MRDSSVAEAWGVPRLTAPIGPPASPPSSARTWRRSARVTTMLASGSPPWSASARVGASGVGSHHVEQGDRAGGRRGRPERLEPVLALAGRQADRAPGCDPPASRPMTMPRTGYRLSSSRRSGRDVVTEP